MPVFNNEYGHGVPEQQPENSVYYHPTLNPSGVPPSGKPQRYRTDPTNGPRVPLPVPAAPPLPAGPAPGERCMSDFCSVYNWYDHTMHPGLRKVRIPSAVPHELFEGACPDASSGMDSGLSSPGTLSHLVILSPQL